MEQTNETTNETLTTEELERLKRIEEDRQAEWEMERMRAERYEPEPIYGSLDSMPNRGREY